MLPHSLGQVTAIVAVVNVCGQALLWLSWLIRYIDRWGPRTALFPGCAIIFFASAIQIALLSFGIFDDFGGLPRRFWLGMGICVSTFLSNLAIVLLSRHIPNHCNR